MKIKKIHFKDPFGHSIGIKRIVIFVFGLITYYRLNHLNKLSIEGVEHLRDLPVKNVLFVSNHQTYFMDVASFIFIFGQVKNRVQKISSSFWTLVNPKLNVFFIAALETMKSGILPRLLAYAGSVSIKRTWREGHKEIKRNADPKDLDKIKLAINSGWVITFPQGSTKPFIPGRRGTAHIIKDLNPIVVPIVINGFRRAFDKKGIRTKKRGTELSIRFKQPLEFNSKDDLDNILDRIMDGIEQSPKHKAFRKFTT